MVVLTGQVPRALIGNDAFQEVDIVGITRPCTKHNYLVNDPEDLVPVMREAFYLAASGRPGPVLVDLPKDVVARIKLSYPEKPIKMQTYQPTYTPIPTRSKRPAGPASRRNGRCSTSAAGLSSPTANEELTELALNLNIPVTMTLMGLGGFPGTDDLSWACSACTALTPPTWRWPMRSAHRRRFPLRRPGHRPLSTPLPPRPRSSISISTPPRSARMSGRHPHRRRLQAALRP
jgi:thiamine pyrophosphate-dependent acetolactate synthase large subunit-like protein